jgi:hypothetical protein
MWNRVVLFAVLLVGILLPLPGQAQADAKPSNLTVTFRLQAPLTAVRFANGAVDGVSLVGGGLGLQWKEFWMVEGGGGLSFWPKNSEAAINYEAHFRGLTCTPAVSNLRPDAPFAMSLTDMVSLICAAMALGAWPPLVRPALAAEDKPADSKGIRRA